MSDLADAHTSNLSSAVEEATSGLHATHSADLHQLRTESSASIEQLRTAHAAEVESLNLARVAIEGSEAKKREVEVANIRLELEATQNVSALPSLPEYGWD